VELQRYSATRDGIRIGRYLPITQQSCQKVRAMMDGVSKGAPQILKRPDIRAAEGDDKQDGTSVWAHRKAEECQARKYSADSRRARNLRKKDTYRASIIGGKPPTCACVTPAMTRIRSGRGERGFYL